MKTVNVNQTATTRQKVPFHVVDQKGRAIGCVILTGEFDRVHAPEGAISYNVDFETGHYFFAMVQSTKDGISWGASQCGKSFTTTEARDEYIKARVAASRKAAEKKFGK